MVQDAEENAEQDKLLKAKVEGRNKLESYLYNVKSTTTEEAFLAKLSAEEKTMLSEAVSDGLEWLEGTELDQCTVEDLEEKQKEVEVIVNPIMTRVYQESGGTPPAGASGGGDGASGDADEDGSGGDGPTVEEVD
jgi:molecular chaperone DnaK (HSP70)